MDRNKTIKVLCKHCGKEFKIKVNSEDYERWKSGPVLIQRALPYLTAGERELLMNQICDGCWNLIFPPDQEDYEL